MVGNDNTAVGKETGSQVHGKFNAAFGGPAVVQVTGDLNFAAVEGAGFKVLCFLNVAIAC